MTAHDFDTVLDRCLTDVLAGRRTVESCLEEWPQFAQRLNDPLRTAIAMQQMRSVDSAASPDARDRFMAALRTTKQQSPPRRFRPWKLSGFPSPALFAPAAAVAALALVLVLFRPFGSGPSAEAATLTTFGIVERAEGDRWRQLPDNAPVHDGDHIRTSPEASAVLTFADGSTVTMDASTEVVLERGYRGTKHPILVRQLAGRVWSNIVAAQPDSFRLDTVAAVVVAARPATFETAIENAETSVHAMEGRIEVRTADERLVPAAGELVRAHVGRQLVRLAVAGSERTAVIHLLGPFAGSLVSPHGLATGATPDGLVYRQIPRTLTTAPGEDESDGQRIRLLTPASGVYTLLVRRTDAGAGSVELGTAGATRRVDIGEAAPAFLIRFRIRTDAEGTSIEVESATSVRPERIENLERLVVTDTARRRAVEVLRQLRERRHGLLHPSATASAH